MNCQSARMAIVERDLGGLTLGFERALSDHLLNCSNCRTADEMDLLLLDGLATLRNEPLPRVDLAAAIARRVRELPQTERHSVPVRDFAWAALAAVAAAVGLAAWISPQAAWLRQALTLAADAAGALLSAAYSTLSALKSLLVLPWRLLSVLAETMAPLLDRLARLEPVAIAAISLGLVSMMLTIVWIVGNDLRRPGSLPWRKDG